MIEPRPLLLAVCLLAACTEVDIVGGNGGGSAGDAPTGGPAAGSHEGGAGEASVGGAGGDGAGCPHLVRSVVLVVARTPFRNRADSVA
jgi:hypothetical protein